MQRLPPSVLPHVTSSNNIFRHSDRHHCDVSVLQQSYNQSVEQRPNVTQAEPDSPARDLRNKELIDEPDTSIPYNDLSHQPWLTTSDPHPRTSCQAAYTATLSLPLLVTPRDYNYCQYIEQPVSQTIVDITSHLQHFRYCSFRSEHYGAAWEQYVWLQCGQLEAFRGDSIVLTGL